MSHELEKASAKARIDKEWKLSNHYPLPKPGGHRRMKARKRHYVSAKVADTSDFPPIRPAIIIFDAGKNVILGILNQYCGEQVRMKQGKF